MNLQAPFLLALAGAALPGSLRAQEPAVGTPVPGEVVPAELHGPSAIRTWDEIEALDRSMPASDAIEDLRNGAHGVWVVPSLGAAALPHSGSRYVLPKWGDTRIGIGFGGPVDLVGAWIGAQGGRGGWTSGLQVVGFRDGREVARTGWFEEVGEEPAWFAMGLERVDRIEFVARPMFGGAGFWSLDDLTFERREGADAGRVVLDFEDLSYHDVLTGSDYAGLTWETGTGDFDAERDRRVEIQVVHPPLEPPGARGEEPTPEGAPSFLGGGGTLPDLELSFVGPKITDNGAGFIPPDTCGAVGPNHFVAVVNQRIAIYDKVTGSQVQGSRLGSFFGVGAGATSGDPRVAYDHFADRWVVIGCNFSSGVRFAYSLSDDPTGAWFTSFVTFSSGTDAGKWPDYPTLGLDADGIYMAAYMVGGNNRLSLFAVDKAPLLGGTPALGTVTAWRSLVHDGDLQPCVTYGSPGSEYVISRSTSTSLRLRRIDGPLTAPTLTNLGLLTTSAGGSPPDAPAMGSNTNLDTVGARLMNAVYRNGSIWTAHCIGQGGRALSRWYEVDPLALSLVQEGTIDDPGMNYFFPTIAVNAAGDVALAFTGSNANMFATAFYTGRLASDPPGQMAPPVSFKDGLGPYNNTDGSGRNRWGDYSLTSVDPADDATLWTIQEYARNNNRWGTFIAELAFDPGQLPLGSTYCDGAAVPNSSGSTGRMVVNGSVVVADDDLTLTADQLPPESNIGYFLMGSGMNTFTPAGSAGPICVSPGLLRILPPVSNTNELLGGFVRTVGTSGAQTGNITMGSTWNFQAWHRDQLFGQSNLTDAVSVLFQ